jgi:capsule polysaccharide modification protein KpsS
MYYKGYKNIFNPLKYFIRYQMSKKYFSKPDYSLKYFYFPLHLQPEASTIVCAQKYENQLFFIDSLVKSIPADTIIYVKEHYAGLGSRKLEFYKNLSKYPNILLIDPLVDTYKLIQNSIGVLTLTGTAGWEAMLLRKPVFIAGNIYFDNAPGIIKVKEIYDNFLPMLKNWKQPSKDEIIKYLCEYFSHTFKGDVNSGNLNNKHCFNQDNINEVAKSLFLRFNKDS